MKILVVFHPTPFCNLDCSYCWAPDRNDRGRMPLQVVSSALSQIYQKQHLTKIDFCWLTGEPLAMGLDHFRSAVALCQSAKPDAVGIRLHIQTNGTLINDDWAEFFATHDFNIGVSIDGPKAVHDGQRLMKGGKPSFELTLRGIDLLVKHGVKGGALCVITKKTLELPPDDLFFFFHERKIAWSYLVEAKIGDNATSQHALSRDDIPRLERFLGRLMDLWGEYPTSHIKDFDALARKLFGSQKSDVDYTSLGCLDILNIMADGDFYWGNPELMSATKGVLRNIRQNLNSSNVWEARSTQAFEDVEAQTHRGIEKCINECPHFSGCRGGNPAHKFYDQGRFDVSSHLTCEINDKVISRLLLDRMEAGLRMPAVEGKHGGYLPNVRSSQAS